mmetsp:Transcript_16310/g.18405  ORF Transcript_16310/g.18405 Transcript_16310/m.18405 type:complete len:89 (+) Transcript_16310:1027-1293(+)
MPGCVRVGGNGIITCLPVSLMGGNARNGSNIIHATSFSDGRDRFSFQIVFLSPVIVHILFFLFRNFTKLQKMEKSLISPTTEILLIQR